MPIEVGVAAELPTRGSVLVDEDPEAAVAAVPIAPSNASARWVLDSLRRWALALNSPHQSSSRTVGQTPSIR